MVLRQTTHEITMTENTEANELQRRLHDAHESSAMLRDRIEELERWVDEGKRNGERCASERDNLQDAVRNLRDVKGRHNSGIAYERLIALLPENVKDQTRAAQTPTQSE